MIKTFIMLQKISISDKCCSELSSENPEKFYSAVFKMYFEQQIRILELFLKDQVTGVMMLKIQL